MKFFKNRIYMSVPMPIIVMLLIGSSSCNGADRLGVNESDSANSSIGSTSGLSTSIPAHRTNRHFTTDVLIFAGAGTWGEEISSLKNILQSHGATYQSVTSAELETMSLEELGQFGLMIFPGGEGGTQAQSLTSDAHARIRQAVQELGVSYLGFCAGSFIAVAPAPSAGNDVSYGLGVVPGPILDYYYLENQLNPDVAMTLETFADGTTRDLLWYGGPVTLNIPGSVVAKYPNGDSAISEVWSGKGFVLLSGPHPAATQATRDAFGLNDSDGLDFDLTWKLINAGIKQEPLSTF